MPDAMAYIGVGSNMDPEHNIPRGLERLADSVTLIAVSTFYRTAPLHHTEQSAFLNGVARIATDLGPRALKFDVLRAIEAKTGRVRTDDPFSPRTLDLDILLFDDLVIDEPGLCVPDSAIRTRVFVAAPLLELDPALTLPDTGEPLADLACLSAAEHLTPAESFTIELRERLGL